MNPTSYNGQTFTSQSDAARQLGVHNSTVWKHLNRYGSLNNLMTRNSSDIPVTIGCRTWSSQTALADAIGVHRSTITRWLKPTASKHQKQRLNQMIAALEESK